MNHTPNAASIWPDFMEPIGLAEAHRDQWRYNLKMALAHPHGSDGRKWFGDKAKRHRRLEAEQLEIAKTKAIIAP